MLQAAVVGGGETMAYRLMQGVPWLVRRSVVHLWLGTCVRGHTTS